MLAGKRSSGPGICRSREHKGGHNLELDPEAEFPVRWSRRARWTGRLESIRLVGTRVVGAVAVQQQHQLPLQPEELLQLAQFGHQPQTGKEQGGGWDEDQTEHLRLLSRAGRL